MAQQTPPQSPQGSTRKTGAGAPRTGRYWAIAAGCFIIMVGASILLSGLSLFTAPIISDLYYAKDATGEVITQSVGGRDLPVEVNGGQGAFLIYFTIMTSCIVIALMFFAGQLLAKLGARRMVNIGGIIMALGLALFASSQGNLMFYAAGALMGLGYGLSIALIPPALINNWFQAKRGLVLGIVLSGTGIGGLIWAGIGPSLAESDLGWRGVIWIMAASMLVCTVLPAVFLIRNDPAELGLPPYGAAVATERTGRPSEAPGFTFAQARRTSVFWITAASFFLFGAVVAVTQVLSIVFRSAAYPNPIDQSTWSAGQIAFYSSLFMVWLACLVLWKPLLGILNDKLGLAGMLIISTALMALAIVYLPSMLYGTPVIFMYAAMVMMSAGISNATVTPPLVVAQAMGGRDFGKIFSLAVAFYYAGNALGAPLWGMLGTAGHYRTGMYVSPILLAIFVLGCIYAARKGRATYLAEPVAGPPSGGPVPPDARVADAQQTDRVEAVAATEPVQQSAADDVDHQQPTPGQPQRST